MATSGGKTKNTEWVEIIEPKTRERMFANLTSGECLWDPPQGEGVTVKHAHANQWWELFDQNTGRFYYYNASTQKTVWHRPTTSSPDSNCDIIPLAKLQTLKQNTEVVTVVNQPTEDSPMKRDDEKKPKKATTEVQTKERSLLVRPSYSNSLNFTRKTKLTLASGQQTSPVESPKVVKRFKRHRSYHLPSALSRDNISGSQRLYHFNEEESMEDDEDSSRVGELRRGYSERHLKYQQQQQQQQRRPSNETKTSLESNNSSLSPLRRQRSELTADYVRLNQNGGAVSKQSPLTSPSSSIARSQSFMARGHQRRPSQDSQNTKESPKSKQRTDFLGGRAEVQSPIESYCTPMVNRKKQSAGQKVVNGFSSNVLRGTTVMKPPEFSTKPSPIQSLDPEKMSISDLVDSGLSTLNEGMNNHMNRNASEDDDDEDPAALYDEVDEDETSESISLRSPASRRNKPPPPVPPQRPSMLQRGPNTGAAKMSPLQQYILEQAKLSGYKFGQKNLPVGGPPLGPNTGGGDGRESYIDESEDDTATWMNRETLEESDFADDEDGGMSDNISKASSIDEGECGDGFLPEPTYNNIDSAWIQNMYSAGYPKGPAPPPPPHADEYHYQRPQQNQRPQLQQQRQSLKSGGGGPVIVPPPASSLRSVNSRDIDQFSEEFDVQMRFNSVNEKSRNFQPPQQQGQQQQHGQNGSSLQRPTSLQQPSVKQVQQQQRNEHQQDPNFPVPYEVLQHPSLPRNSSSLVETNLGHPHQQGPPSNRISISSSTGRGNNGIFLGGGTLGRNTRMSSRGPQGASATNVPFGTSGVSASGSMLSVSASLHSTVSVESDIERYAAQGGLNIQKRGIFRKRLTVKDILTHSKESLRKPLTCLNDKNCKKEALETYRLVQIYMGDRRAKPGMTINSVAVDITSRGYTKSALCDEIFVQMCKQTSENPSRESLRRGWELLAICLSFFPPSASFHPALAAYVHKHRDPALDMPEVGKWPIHVQISHYAGVCAKRLERIANNSGRLAPRKPTIEDIDQSRLHIFRPSMFGGTLDETMDIQRDRFPHRRLPWILTTLAEQILQLNGTNTEGIFRVPADLDEVASIKCRFDQWEIPACADCHTAASLMKQWFRDLYQPIIPDSLYDRCVASAEDAQASCDIVFNALPELNRGVLSFLVRFLQIFARPEVATVTKMDTSNLATVFAPNCLRCPSKDPSVILENTRKEMAFVKSLIVNLDTSCMEGVL